MKATNKTTTIESIVKKHVTNTNQKLKNLEGSSSKLFKAIKEAVDAFGNDKKALKLYRKELHTNHRSTISMMIRVANNGYIRQYEQNLPTSYQTLNELIKLINELEKSNHSSFKLLIRKGEIHPEITKSDVVNLRNKIKAETTVVTHKTASYEKESEVKTTKINDVASVKTISLNEVEDFVTNLDEETRVRLLELLTETQNVKEAA